MLRKLQKLPLGAFLVGNSELWELDLAIVGNIAGFGADLKRLILRDFADGMSPILGGGIRIAGILWNANLLIHDFRR
jgi:hypothetical protein